MMATCRRFSKRSGARSLNRSCLPLPSPIARIAATTSCVRRRLSRMAGAKELIARRTGEVGSVDADYCPQGFADRPVEYEIGDRVEAGRLAVDDDQCGTVALGQFREPGRRIDDERGAGDDEQIGGARLDLGAPHRLDRHRLAEGDRCSLDPAPAGAANRCRAVALEGATQFANLVPPRAIEAVRVGRVAVQLDDLVHGNAGGPMEAVDVLGDHRSGGTAADELGNGAMPAVRLRVSPGVIGFEAAPPSFAPSFLGGKEIREIDWRHLGPDP